MSSFVNLIGRHMNFVAGLVGALLCCTSAYAMAKKVGWVLADQPSAIAPYSPSAATSYSSSGNGITVTHLGTGFYEIEFENLDDHLGNMQVSAFNSNKYCVAGGPVAFQPPSNVLLVICFDTNANYADTMFTLAYQYRSSSDLVGTSQKGLAYLEDGEFGVQASQYNSTGGTNTFVRNSVGNYTITLPGLLKNGDVQVTASDNQNVNLTPGQLSAPPARCKPSGWSAGTGGTTVNIRCFDTSGSDLAVFADERNYLSYALAEPLAQGNGATAKAAYALANKPTLTSSYVPSAAYQYNGFGTGKLTVQRTAVGQYTVTIPGSPSFTTSTALVTAVGNNADYCNVMSWLPINVACFAPNGSPADSQFAVSFQAH